MPKIKVNINWLKWNLAWVVKTIKAFLMQNFGLVALPVLERWRHKISLERREWVIKFGYLPQENGLNLKNWVFMSRIVLLDPKLTPPPPMSISASRGKLEQPKFQEFSDFLFIFMFSFPWPFHNILNYASTWNIRENMRFCNLCGQSLETNFRGKLFLIFKIFGTSRWEKSSSNPLIHQFC